MDKGFVEALKSGLVEPVVLGDGHDAVPPGWIRLDKQIPITSALELSTLQAIVDYTHENPDDLTLDELLVVVAAPDRVRVIGQLESEAVHFRRGNYLDVRARLPEFRDDWIPHEDFVIQLQAGYVPTAERNELVAILASVKDSDGTTSMDDGVSQQIATQRGAALVGTAKLPSPVVLAPYRTFSEVEQPWSRFVLRLRKMTDRYDVRGISFRLFEADGGAWRAQACGAVATWLRNNLPVGPKVIG